MTNPTDHELERVLARVAGVEITESKPGKDGSVCWCFLKDIEQGRPRRKFIYSKWAPLHDANQMERVKAKLREMGLGYQMNWNGLMGAHQVFLYRAGFRDDPSPKTKDKSELRAFALAVCACDEAITERNDPDMTIKRSPFSAENGSGLPQE